MKKLSTFILLLTTIVTTFAQTKLTFSGERQEFVDFIPEKIKFKSDFSVIVKDVNFTFNEVSVSVNGVTHTYTGKLSEQNESEQRASSLVDSLLEAKFADIIVKNAGDPVADIGSPPPPLDQFLERINEFPDKSEVLVEKEKIESQVKATQTADEAKSLFEELEEHKFITTNVNTLFKDSEALLKQVKEEQGTLPYALIVKYEHQLKEAQEVNQIVNEILELQKSLDKSNYKSVYHFPKITSDEIVVTITVKEKKKEATERTYSKSLPITGKFKVDLSTGLILNFENHKNYFLTEVDDATVEIGESSSQRVVPVYPVLMTNFYTTKKGNLNYGGTIGFGISEGAKTSFYVGGSLFWGNRERLILTGGVSFRQRSFLKPRFNKGDLVNSSFEASDLTLEKYKAGFFLSLTYNLFDSIQSKKTQL